MTGATEQAGVRRAYGGVSATERISARRTALLEAGLEVVGRDGVASFSIEAVCAEAALGKRYFYESFPDRDALLLELADVLFADLCDRMAGDVAAYEDRTERSRAVVGTLVAVLAGDQRRARLYAESAGHPLLSRRREQAVQEFTAFIAEHVLPGSSSSDRELTTRLLVAGTTDLVTSWLLGEIEATSDAVVDAIVRVGLAIAAEE